MVRSASAIAGVLMLLISIGPALADQRSLLIGTWAVDVAKLAMPDSPKSVAIVFAAVGGGGYEIDVKIVDDTGTTRHGESIFTPDGTPAREVLFDRV